MLISDGAPYNYADIFEQYNWRDLPYMPVRVFTYLIGKEVADVKEIKWMACANQGYYVHLSDLAEVREQVLNYIPVMARPLVLGRHDHPVIWTQVYADQVVHIKLNKFFSLFFILFLFNYKILYTISIVYFLFFSFFLNIGSTND